VSTILVATRDGLHAFDPDGAPGSVAFGGRDVTSLGRAGDEHWAVLDRSEIWHAVGDEWTHVTDLDGRFRANFVARMAGQVFVGSSEARLFRVDGEASSVEPIEAFDRAEGRDSWYTPWGGPPDTRSMANWDEDVYVNVHVGGIQRTSDSGESWTPTIDIDADVHHVTTAEGLVLAACAGGLASSTDRGASWTMRTDGLERRYARCAAVCGDAMLLSASRGPRGGEAAVYRGGLSSGAFERCRAGLPDWFDDNIDTYCLEALPDGELAAFGTTDGEVYASRDQGSSWEQVAPGLASVNRVLVMP
jgi:hypothetical protein